MAFSLNVETMMGGIACDRPRHAAAQSSGFEDGRRPQALGSKAFDAGTPTPKNISSQPIRSAVLPAGLLAMGKSRNITIAPAISRMSALPVRFKVLASSKQSSDEQGDSGTLVLGYERCPAGIRKSLGLLP